MSLECKQKYKEMKRFGFLTVQNKEVSQKLLKVFQRAFKVLGFEILGVLGLSFRHSGGFLGLSF